MNTYSFVSRSHGRWLRVAIALPAALGILAACNNDDSSNASNYPVIVPVPNAVVIADVNGDGAPDLLVATTADQGQTHNPGFANVILNTPGSLGTFAKGTGLQYATTGSDPSSIALADLSGSGSLDMVVANFGSGSVSVFTHGSTPGTFMPAVDVPTGGAPNQVVSCDPHGAAHGAVPCDLTGNGKPSLILADMSNAGNAIVLMADPAHPGQFLTLKLPTGAFTTSAVVGSVKGDGTPDIVACGSDTSGNNGAVYVFIQDRNNRGTFAPPVSFPAGAQPQSVKIADVNGDGLPDLIVANLGPGRDGNGSAGVSVLLQDKSHPGSFLPPVTYTTPGASIDVAVGSCPGASCSDLNGDNLPDLVVANLAPDPTGSISVLLQDPAHPGTFLAATNYPAFGQPLSVAIADLNGDGHRDIAAADGASAIVLFQNAASPGTFAPAVQVGF